MMNTQYCLEPGRNKFRKDMDSVTKIRDRAQFVRSFVRSFAPTRAFASERASELAARERK